MHKSRVAGSPIKITSALKLQDFDKIFIFIEREKEKTMRQLHQVVLYIILSQNEHQAALTPRITTAKSWIYLGGLLTKIIADHV